MRNEITEQEIEEFRRRNPGASVSEYINERNRKIKQSFGDSKPTTRTFFDISEVELADLEPEEEPSDFEDKATCDRQVPTFTELADKEL